MAYTRAQVRSLIRKRCALENTSTRVDADLNEIINDAEAYKHDFLIATLGENYALNYVDFTSTANVAEYSISALSADDFYRLASLRLMISDVSLPLESYSIYDQAWTTVATSWGPHFLPRYRLYTDADGDHFLEFTPVPDAAESVRVYYHTPPVEYTTDAQLIRGEKSHVDLMIAESCIRVKEKEERDPGRFVQQRAEIQKRIEDWASQRDQSNPDRTLLVRPSRRRGNLY